MIKGAVIVFSTICLCTCDLAVAFDPSSSYSLIKFNGLEKGVSSQMGIGLISTTFSDSFSRVVSLGTATEIRFLEAKKPVNRAEIEKYVEEQYRALPEQDKNQFKETLIKAKTTDEILKSKMANPSLSDDEKLIYAQERERLLKNVWEYEAKLLDKYAELFKPEKYLEVNNELISLDLKREGAIACWVDKDCDGTEEEKSQAFVSIENKITSLVVELIRSPVEPDKASDKTARSYMDAIKKDKLEIDHYLKKLYSKH